MSSATIGIDFGTTTSSMAWVDPRTGEAKVIKNAEGEEKTPSVVYFGERETLVGSPAEQMLEDESERRRVVQSVKRELVNTRTLALPGRRVKAVEVAAEVLKKLKCDAEDLHFHESVERAVVTCPAAFGPLERDEIERAARLAGFAEVRLLEEPVAAALAYSRQGLGIGRHILVYDLGGGTFDLALLREVDGSYKLAMEPKGLPSCGGDDFDIALYEWCEEEALRQWGAPIDERGLDLRFLRDCRKRKENLSVHDQVQFSSLIGAGRVFKHTLTRDLLESVIGPRIEATVRLTGELVRTAKVQGYEVDTVVLIGGSTRIPLVQRRLRETLPVEPHRWQHQDVAVALGAAYFAQKSWQLKPGSDVAAFVTDGADDRHRHFAEFFVTHPMAWEALLGAVCDTYPCSETLIERYVERWDWNALSENPALPWSEALIERFAEQWCWTANLHPGPSECLSRNHGLPWSESLIERYVSQWCWRELSANEALPWSETLIERYAGRWDWDRLSGNAALPWSDALIKRYVERWCWRKRWSYYRELLYNGDGLSGNPSLLLSEELIERHAERWDWEQLSRNSVLPWSEELIERFSERWSWGRLSANKMLPWSEALIRRFGGRLDWRDLSSNESLPWSEGLIEMYAKRWDWERLSGNSALPWSEGLIEMYSKRWDWYWLSENSALPWSEALIERHAERWDWGRLSCNSALPWSEALIERYAERWSWDGIILRELVTKWTEPQISAFIDYDGKTTGFAGETEKV